MLEVFLLSSKIGAFFNIQYMQKKECDVVTFCLLFAHKLIERTSDSELEEVRYAA